jgi:hypothetical protein
MKEKKTGVSGQDGTMVLQGKQALPEQDALDGAKGEDGGVVEDRLVAVETKVKCLSDSDADDFILRGCKSTFRMVLLMQHAP